MTDAMAKWAPLKPGTANRTTLSPVTFLRRSAEVYPDRVAVVHGDQRWTYAQTYERATRLASALQRHGVARGDVVATMLPNVPAMIEAHYGVPMAGGVLCTINTRLEADTVAYILAHGEARVVIVDRQFAPIVQAALTKMTHKLLVIDNDDPQYSGPGDRIGRMDYDAFLVQCFTLIGTYERRLCPRGVVANPRHAKRHVCGLRLATRPNPLAHKYRQA